MRRTHWTLALLAAAGWTLSACGNADPSERPADEPVETASAPASDGAPVKLEDPPVGQLPEGVTPTAYALDLVLDPADTSFSGTVAIDLTLDAPHARIWLHAQGPDVTRVYAAVGDNTIDGTFHGDQAEGGVSRIDFETPIPAGRAVLHIAYTAPYDTTLAGLYRADQNALPYLASQMEPDDARRMVPSFDEPRFKTPWTTTITAPSDIEVVTNGALVSTTPAENGFVKRSFKTTRPLPSYLLGFAVGPYDKVIGKDISPNGFDRPPIPFRGFAPKGKGDKLAEAMDATHQMVAYQETYFGVPYPYGKLDIAAVPDFAFGAMENAGIIIYRESALLIDERTSLSRKRSILSIHAHELAHQWFGNLVTPKWWDDIWLNEAFATWFAYKTMHDYDPDGGFDRTATRRALGAMGNDSLKSARQIRNPIERNGDIMDAFDGITYSKGGGVLSMFEAYLGEDAFREGVRVHMQRFPDGVADVNDFMASLAEGSGDETVVEAFKSFIFQPGIPYLNVEVVCEDPSDKHLKISQSRYAPLGSEIDTGQLWQVPFSARWGSADGSGGSMQMMLTEASSILPFEEGPCPDWVMPNADGKGYWRFTTNPENWAGLTEAFGSLTPGEQLVFADSVTAAFNAGSIDASTMLSGIAATTSGTWDGATQGIDEIAAYARLLPESDLPAFHTWIAETYGPAWEFYGDRTAAQLDQGERLLQEELYNAMVSLARDPDMRANLKDRAYAFVGVNGEPDPSAVAPAELFTAMSVAAEDGGTAFVEAALATTYASSNQNERSTVFAALAQSLPEMDVAVLLKEANGSEFTGREMYSTFMNAMQNPRARNQNWTLFQQSWQNLVARTPAVRKARLARAVGGFCDASKAEAATDFFRANADDIPGYERSLAQGLEQAQLCAALKTAKADELTAALSAE